MSNTPRASWVRWLMYAVIVVLFAAIAGLILALQQNIATRKREATATVFQIVGIDETTADPAEWGKNFSRQYDGYKRTVDIEQTKHGGSEAFQKLDADDRWRDIFAGYAFSIDYREERGHAYMLSDQRETERVTKRKQPGACLHCHASNVVAYREAGIKQGAPGSAKDPLQSAAGQEQLMKGFEAVCAMPYDEATTLVGHPVSCIDCHDPSTMALRVTKPGFINGIRVLAESDAPLPHLPSVERWRKGHRQKPYDPNIDASRQEMRSLACAQCHVEYYFKGEGKLLTYPWHRGIKVEQIESYYDAAAYKDWTHELTGAPVLKAQHPEFEMWSQGIHARSGVACADCHMPYRREGAIKISDHHVRSPLLNIARACQTCHNYTETEINARVTAIQDRTADLLNRGTAAMNDLIKALEAAKKAGASDEELKSARDLQRKAQWRLDFVAAENSMGFHAPQEAARILGEAIDYARRGELAVAQRGK
jgi:nitrite reductase (cytochrome c-552)